MSITVLELREELDKMIRNNPDCANWEVRTIADDNDDDLTRVVGAPTECNIDDFSCMTWLGGEEQRIEYELIIEDAAPANVIII